MLPLYVPAVDFHVELLVAFCGCGVEVYVELQVTVGAAFDCHVDFHVRVHLCVVVQVDLTVVVVVGFKLSLMLKSIVTLV